MLSGHKSVFEALALLAPTPFDEISPNLVQGCSVRRSLKIMKFRGVQKLGGQNFDFSEKFYFHHFWANYAKINKFGSKKIWCKKQKISKLFITILTPPAMCNVTGLYKHDNSKCITKQNLMISKLMARNIWPLVQNRNEEEWTKSILMNGDFLWVGWIFATRPGLFVCGCVSQFVQGLL